MDDFTLSTLNESRNEWTARLVSILTPLLIEGFNSLFDEAWNLCKENEEEEKYLMTFQNLIARVPKWNNEIIGKECQRIIDRSNCNYLEELISCVHVIQLKILTCVRVGKMQKKIDISIPILSEFIHKTYIFVARKLYANVYLFEKGIPPLQKQKNLRELELIIQDAILLSVRDSMPIENILRAYLDETVEHDVSQEVIEEKIEVTEDKNIEDKKDDKSDENNNTPKLEDKIEKQEKLIEELEKKPSLSFNDLDSALDENNEKQEISAPKTIERLEEISELRNKQRKEENEEDDDEEEYNSRIKIEDTNIDLSELDVHDLTKEKKNKINLEPDPILDDIEVLQ